MTNQKLLDKTISDELIIQKISEKIEKNLLQTLQYQIVKGIIIEIIIMNQMHMYLI